MCHLQPFTAIYNYLQLFCKGVFDVVILPPLLPLESDLVMGLSQPRLVYRQ